MIHHLPTEHLSPYQITAFNALKSSDSTQVKSVSFDALIEIISLLIGNVRLGISCDPHTKRLLQDYQKRHQQVINQEDIATYQKNYKDSIERIKEEYRNAYPSDNQSIHHRHIEYLKRIGTSTIDTNTIESDNILAENLEYDIIQIEKLLMSYKRSWQKYQLIDPLELKYYRSSDNAHLDKYVKRWINTSTAIINDLQKGLQEIVNEEKYRLQAIKKQVQQHLVNYQHANDESELKTIRQKMAFLLTDLPKNSFSDFTDLVMFALTNWDDATSKYLYRYGKRFNSRNHESVLCHEAIQELRVLVREIENNGKLKLVTANKALSYATQIELVKDLKFQLNYCIHWLDDEQDYVEWQTFYLNLDNRSKKFVDSCKSMDKLALRNLMNKLKIKKWVKDVTQGGIPNIDSSLSLFEAYKELSATCNWSNIYLVNEGEEVHYKVTYDGAHYTLSNSCKSQSITNIILNDKTLYTVKPMVTLDYYNKSQQAKYLTDALMSARTDYRTFQTKNISVISCLDEIHTQQMQDLLGHNRLNELKGESVADLVKGIILEEKKEKYIVVYDELLNVDRTEHYIWQRLILQCLSTAGYKILSIDVSNTLNGIGLAELFGNHATPISEASRSHQDL